MAAGESGREDHCGRLMESAIELLQRELGAEVVAEDPEDGRVRSLQLLSSLQAEQVEAR